jgi:hypothetical protein
LQVFFERLKELVILIFVALTEWKKNLSNLKPNNASTDNPSTKNLSTHQPKKHQPKTYQPIN